MTRVMPVREANDWLEARRLVEEYARSLKVDLCFQEYDKEIGDLPHHYGPPGGAFFLAVRDDETVGCIAVRRFADDACEMKRLFVRPAGRGLGLGRTLAETAIAEARRLGYARMLLDTLPFMTEAQALYRSLGFAAVPEYRPNPVPG